MNKQQRETPVGQFRARINSNNADNVNRITAPDLAGRLNAKRNGQGWMARCPAHEDRTPSLHISERQDGSVGIHCYAGCKFREVIAALGIESYQLQPARADNNDPLGSLASARGWRRKALELLGAKPSENGREVHFSMRNAHGDVIGHRRRRADGQKFANDVKALSKKNGKNGLIMTHPMPEGTVCITESEADAVAILTHNPELAVIATPGSTPGHACINYLKTVTKGRDVVLLPDPDSAGAKWARDLEHKLRNSNVSIVPPGEVDTDKRLKAGESLEEILSTAKRPFTNEQREDVDIDGAWLDVIRAIAKIIAPKHEFFFHAGEIVRLATETDIPHFEPLTPVQACSELERFCRFIQIDKKGEEHPKRLTESTARPIINAPEFRRKMPKIKRLADYPMPIKQSGKPRLSNSGYDPKTETYTDPRGPTPEAMVLEKADALIDDLLSGFCFAEIDGDGGAHYKLNAIAYLLTCHCRFLIEPERAPIFYVGGNRPGVRKDYLLGLGPLLTTGTLPEFHPPTKDGEETRKRILSICRAGRRFMIISNARGHLADEALEQAATSPQHTDRVLGQSEELTFPNMAIYAISGNQLSYSEDLSRRMTPIELEFFGENIEERKFEHPDLYSHVLNNRAKYLGALQAMVDNWTKAGCNPGSKTKSSFVQWAKVIGGIIESCEKPNPINEDPTTATPNEEAEHFGKLLKAVHDKHGSSSLAAKDVQEVAVENELFAWLGDLECEKRAQIRFGLILKRMEKRRFAGLSAIADRTTTRVRWQVRENK